MRRESRQRGMVRTTTTNPKPAVTVQISQPDPEPMLVAMGGMLVKVPNKPTNHSKFTGKCEVARCSTCHLHPVSKAKDKSKGARKVKAFNEKLSYKTLSWTIMADLDGSDKSLVAGRSATQVLDDLSYGRRDDAFDRDEYFADDVPYVCASDVEDYYDGPESPMGPQDDGPQDPFVGPVVGFVVDDEVVMNEGGDGDEIIVHGGVTVDGDEGYDGFFDISGVWNAMDDDEDEGWSIIGAM